MHIRSILAIARKDALDILLNKATLTLLLTPIFLAVLFVVIAALLGSHTTNALIYKPGKSGVEQIISSAFSDIKITYANSPGDVAGTFGPDRKHKTTSYALGLVVPADFDANLRAGGHPQLNLYIDGSQVGNVQSQLLLRALTDYARSVANPRPPASITVATVNPPSPANNALQDIGQVYSTAILLSSFLVGTSLVPGLLAEEKEKKTLRMLMVSPASFSDVVAAKLCRPGLSTPTGDGSPGHQRWLYRRGTPGVAVYTARILLQCQSGATRRKHFSDNDRHRRILRDDILHLYPADFLCG